MKKNILFLTLFTIFGLLFVANLASAQSITGIVANLASIVTKVAIFVTVVFWIITGLLFLTAQGDPGKLGKAKTALIGAIIGTAVSFLSGSATTIIGNALITGN